MVQAQPAVNTDRRARRKTVGNTEVVAVVGAPCTLGGAILRAGESHYSTRWMEEEEEVEEDFIQKTTLEAGLLLSPMLVASACCCLPGWVESLTERTVMGSNSNGTTAACCNAVATAAVATALQQQQEQQQQGYDQLPGGYFLITFRSWYRHILKHPIPHSHLLPASNLSLLSSYSNSLLNTQ